MVVAGTIELRANMDLPKTASAVVIGGGVVGCSIAYNLARRGLAGVVVVERETVGSGTTSKAAGGIRVQFPTETEIRFSLEAIRVFERFQDEFGVDPGYKKIGYLFLALRSHAAQRIREADRAADQARRRRAGHHAR